MPKEVAFQHSIGSTPTLAAAHAVIAMMKGDGAGPVWLPLVKFLKSHFSIFEVLNID